MDLDLGSDHDLDLDLGSDHDLDLELGSDLDLKVGIGSELELMIEGCMDVSLDVLVSMGAGVMIVVLLVALFSGV